MSIEASLRICIHSKSGDEYAWIDRIEKESLSRFDGLKQCT